MKKKAFAIQKRLGNFCRERFGIKMPFTAQQEVCKNLILKFGEVSRGIQRL